MKKPRGFSLRAVAVVEMDHNHRHRVKIRGGFRGARRTYWISLSALNRPAVASTLTDVFGRLLKPTDPLIRKLRRRALQLPRLTGTSRLGWTSSHDAYIYAKKILYRDEQPKRRYAFVAPEGTIMEDAVSAFRPKGSRESQYDVLRRLWDSSRAAQLVISLASVNPFLEVIG